MRHIWQWGAHLSVVALSASCTAVLPPDAITSLQVAVSSTSVASGRTERITATAVFADRSRADFSSAVEWATSAPTVALVLCGPTGCSLATLVPGTATLTATYGGLTGTATIAVTPAVLVSLAAGDEDSIVATGTTTNLFVEGTYTDQSVEDVSSDVAWSSSDPGVASVAGGVASGLSPGSVELTATLSGLSASVTLTVSSATPTALTLSPGTVTLAVGQTQPLKATATLSDGRTQDVTASTRWTSSDTAIATVGSATGLITAVSSGPATIAGVFRELSASESITVTATAVTGIVISSADTSLFAGQTLPLAATATYTDGTTGVVTDQVAWTALAPAVANVANGNGMSGVVTGYATGTASFTAALAGILSAPFALTVEPVTLEGLTIVPPALPVRQGDPPLQLTAEGNYSDGSTADVTANCVWSATGAASISAGGLLTGTAAGPATVTATDGAATAVTNVQIHPAELLQLTVAPPNPTAAIGTTLALTVTGLWSDGTSRDETGLATWATDPSGIATFTLPAGVTGAAGTVYCSAAGVTEVSASETDPDTLATVVGTTVLTCQ